MSFEPLAHARTLPARLKSANIPAELIDGRRGRCAPGPQPGDGPCTSHLLEPARPEEDGDDTDSETSESVTTSSEPHSPLPERVDATAPMGGTSHPVKPLIINTEATPPPSPRPGLPSAQPTSSGKAPAGSRPPAKRAGTIRKLFRRTNSHTPDEQSSPSKASPPASNQGAGLLLLKAQRKSSFSISAENSPSESETNTPPTPGSPVAPAGLLVPPAAEAHPKPNRSSTGLSLKLVGFSSPSKQQRPVAGRVRSPSSSSIHSYASTSSPFSLHAAEGAGVKARRTSAHLPEDFYVETAELDDEFVSASKIRRRKEIGKGATATVKIMVRRGQTKGDQYAVKEFRKRAANESEAEYVRKVKSEYSIAKSLNHPNIVKTVRLCTHAGRWNHVMEYCQNGELFSLVGRKYLQQEDKLCFFKQVLRGVAYLHDNGIAHRDIKLENLLLTDQGHVKITDFGVSEVFCGVHPGFLWADEECGRKMEECRRSAPGICGSLPYIAPEVLAKTGEYDPRQLDVWSCAILYLTMFHGGNVWSKADRSDPHYRRFAEGWDDFLATHPEVVVDENHHPNCGPVTASLPNAGQRRLILKMLHPIPERRITIRDALKDRCVKNIECCVADENSDAPVGIDFASKDACRMAAKMKVQKKHNHQPPPLKRLPQHRFDMGDGTSRYD